MSNTTTAVRRIAVAVAAGAMVAGITGCGSGDDSRAAKSVEPTGTYRGPSNPIVIGWGERHEPTGITTPSANDVDARCTGSGDSLAVEITAPYGWTMRAHHGSTVLSVENSDQHLKADLETHNQAVVNGRGGREEIDWSTPDQVDFDVTVTVPNDWYSPYGRNQDFYAGLHVNCT